MFCSGADLAREGGVSVDAFSAFVQTLSRASSLPQGRGVFEPCETLTQGRGVFKPCETLTQVRGVFEPCGLLTQVGDE